MLTPEQYSHRNHTIWMAREMGASFTFLAKVFNINPTRVREIYIRQERARKKKAEAAAAWERRQALLASSPEIISGIRLFGHKIRAPQDSC
jgi:hypothetical protein